MHTFLFADMCGFTEYTWRHGDERAAKLAVAFHARAGEMALEEDCHLVKSIGDAVMVHADDCRDALRLASRILSLSEREGFPPIRVGVDLGPAVAHEGDWYGSAVNTAARLTHAAAPGELAVTERACSAADGARAGLVARGVWRLKGLPGVRVHAAAAA